jgi:hypothetical protein
MMQVTLELAMLGHAAVTIGGDDNRVLAIGLGKEA